MKPLLRYAISLLGILAWILFVIVFYMYIAYDRQPKPIDILTILYGIITYFGIQITYKNN